MAKKQKLINELVIFAVGLGVLLSIVATFCLTDDNRERVKFWGYSRSYALGIPLLVIAAIYSLSGIILAITKAKVGVYCCIISGFLFAAFYLAFEVESRGTPFSTGLVAIAFYAIPVLQIVRGMKVVKKIDDESTIVTAVAVDESVDATIIDHESQ